MSNVILFDNSIKNIKRISKEYFDSQEIMQPFLDILTPFNISSFSYGRIYPDQSTIHLTTDPSFCFYFIENKLYEQAYYANFSNYEDYNYLINIDDAPEVFIPWQEITKNRSGITLVRKRKLFCEMSYFSSNESSHHIVNLFLNQTKLFEELSSCFCNLYQDLIRKREKERFKFTKTTKDDFVVNKIAENMLITIQRSKLAIEIQADLRSKYESLSIKEQACFPYILQGYSVKDIAKILARSPKTIEKHSINIKNKLGFKTIKQLIASYSSNLEL